jgi:ankyrin repeat protein
MYDLIQLILDGRTQKVLFLLSQKSYSLLELNKPDALNNTPLHWAAMLGDNVLIIALLRHGAKASKLLLNHEGKTPYQAANYPSLNSSSLRQLKPYLHVNDKTFTYAHDKKLA